MQLTKTKLGLLVFISAGCLTMCSINESKAQKINNLKVEKVMDDIIISFDLQAINNPQEMYDIKIFSSHDKYTTAIELKEGIQKDIFPKLNMRYTIDAKKVFAGFEGSVDFKIVATLSFMPISFVYPAETIKIKTGKSLEMMWKGGGSNAAFKLEYANDGGAWNTLDSEIRDNKYTWFIPKKTQKGTYAMKLTSSEPRAKAAFSGNITVKRKKSPFIVIVPLLAVGAGAYFFLMPKDETPIVPVDNSLPNPPSPPSIVAF